MKTLYLHIGTPKTGTTSIQRFFREHPHFLKKQGYVYPDFGKIYEGVGVARNGHFLVLNKDEFKEAYIDAVKKIKKLSKKYNNIIISEEAVWNNSKNIKTFIDDMKLNDIKVKIILYLRRQDLFLQSKWAQAVKEGETTMNFNEYIKVQKNKLDYYNQCCKLQELVGENNLIIRVFEKQQFIGDNHNYFTDFFEALNLKYEKKIDFQQKVRNQSLTGIYLEVKRMLNYYPEFNTRFNFIVKYLNKVAKERGENESYSTNKYFTYEEQIEFLSKYDEGNKKIAKEFLLREDGILFREEITENECGTKTYTTEEYVDILAAIILKQQKNRMKIINKLKNISILRKIKSRIKIGRE